MVRNDPEILCDQNARDIRRYVCVCVYICISAVWLPEVRSLPRRVRPVKMPHPMDPGLSRRRSRRRRRVIYYN